MHGQDKSMKMLGCPWKGLVVITAGVERPFIEMGWTGAPYTRILSLMAFIHPLCDGHSAKTQKKWFIKG